MLRILANENFPGDAVVALRNNGHDVVWVRTDAPGSSDQDILAWAQAERRILITFDKDFGELAFRYGLPSSCGVVLFRIATPQRRTECPRSPSLRLRPRAISRLLRMAESE